jgi:hypothetical protein
MAPATERQAVQLISSTIPEPQPEATLRRARAGRRVVIGMLALFVAAGMFGVFGSKTAVATGSGGGYTLTVTYPHVTRPGLAVRWEYEVRHQGGFDGPIRLATTFDYLHLFDTNNLEPDASSHTATADLIVWEFDPPPGDVFRVSFDATTEVGIHELPSASASILVDGRAILSVPFRTVVMP